jgi:hypothetical protein
LNAGCAARGNNSFTIFLGATLTLPHDIVCRKAGI